jgi:hypothetical protein
MTVIGKSIAFIEHMCKGRYSSGDPGTINSYIIAEMPVNEKKNSTQVFTLSLKRLKTRYIITVSKNTNKRLTICGIVKVPQTIEHLLNALNDTMRIIALYTFFVKIFFYYGELCNIL